MTSRTVKRTREESLDRPKLPTTREIWNWFVTKEATAPCFIRDVYEMRQHIENGKEDEFFWLGRVPCRTVRIVALVVGVTIWEKRVTYTLDDGSGVIDCVHKQPPAVMQSRSSSGASTSKEVLILPTPIADVGDAVRIEGRVAKWHESRQIIASNIVKCTTFNEEPLHWRTVIGLHKSSYSSPEPFVVPPPPNVTVQTPKKVRTTDCQTPSTTGYETPSSSRTAGRINDAANSKSPLKLRHPSRLHSHDLTAITFSRYVKHYMDNSIPRQNSGCRSGSEVSDDDEFESPSTPTRSSRNKLGNGGLLTPRASAQTHCTPRASRNSKASSDKSETLGFTLSYLRRVPELAEMAHRVILAEAKRRRREERKKENATASKRVPAVPTKSQPKSAKKPEPTRTKMKRLFSWAVVKLFQEGGIIIWDGPVRSIPNSGELSGDGRLLWRSNVSSINADSSIFSTSNTTSSFVQDGEEDAGVLSDPGENEEAYVSISPAFLSGIVENAIQTIMSRPATTAASRSRGRSNAPPPGPTKAEITAHLQRSDGRWAKIGEWDVSLALEYLERDGKAWNIGEGRWELCL